MSRKDVAVGAIVAIPFGSVFAVAKILYVSEYFKQIALFKIYRYKISENAEYVNVLGSDKFQLLYTGTSLVKKGSWIRLGNEALSSSEADASKRIVGGEVWFGDECLGPATDEEMKSLPRQRVFNVRFVEDKVNDFPGFTEIL